MSRKSGNLTPSEFKALPASLRRDVLAVCNEAETKSRGFASEDAWVRENRDPSTWVVGRDVKSAEESLLVFGGCGLSDRFGRTVEALRSLAWERRMFARSFRTARRLSDCYNGTVDDVVAALEARRGRFLSAETTDLVIRDLRRSGSRVARLVKDVKIAAKGGIKALVADHEAEKAAANKAAQDAQVVAAAAVADAVQAAQNGASVEEIAVKMDAIAETAAAAGKAGAESINVYVAAGASPLPPAIVPEAQAPVVKCECGATMDPVLDDGDLGVTFACGASGAPSTSVGADEAPAEIPSETFAPCRAPIAVRGETKDKAVSKFVEALVATLDGIRAEINGDDLGDTEFRSDRDAFADVVVHVGDVEVRRVVLGRGPVPPVALSYDGAGFSWLSYQGGTDRYRDKIRAVAEENGFEAENATSWATTFWAK